MALYAVVDEAHGFFWRGSMPKLRKSITSTAIVALLAGTIGTTPASAWYYNNNGAAIAGAMIGGMALGAAVGALASQPSYGYGYGYARAFGGDYGYGYAPYRAAPAYGYGPGYGYGYPHHHVRYYDYDD
jgi:hypothetical protein